MPSICFYYYYYYFPHENIGKGTYPNLKRPGNRGKQFTILVRLHINSVCLKFQFLWIFEQIRINTLFFVFLSLQTMTNWNKLWINCSKQKRSVEEASDIINYVNYVINTCKITENKKFIV